MIDTCSPQNWLIDQPLSMDRLLPEQRRFVRGRQRLAKRFNEMPQWASPQFAIGGRRVRPNSTLDTNSHYGGRECLNMCLRLLRTYAFVLGGKRPLEYHDMGKPFLLFWQIAKHITLATLYIVNAVSALDDALKFAMEASATPAEIEKEDSLGKRILFLEKCNALSNPGYLRDIKNMRNRFAHEVGKYATWQDLWVVLDGVRNEIQYLQRQKAQPFVVGDLSRQARQVPELKLEWKRSRQSSSRGG
ncbi:MAG: hypothetical protein IPP41_07905 [Rhodocyclaceae bacterium]|nr:hypothetical protein [Rhodocyclaceae bacterium]